MMKIITRLLLVTSVLSTPTHATDACKMVLCMYGKATGNNGGEACRSVEKAFFSINAFKKKRRFNPAKTFDMRKAFLGECKAADPIAVSQILNQFGRIRG